MRGERYSRHGQDRYDERDRDARVPGAAPRGRAEYGMDRPNLGSARSDYGRYAYGGRLGEEGVGRGRRRRGDRDFFERAGDEVRSWFGDEEAERRRRRDERGDGRRYRGGEGYGSRRGYYGRGERWADVRARDVMTRDVATVRPGDSAEHAAWLMLDCDCGAIPVVERDGRVVGMVTDRDIAVRLVARAADTQRARVGDCMTDEVFACREDDSVEECMREMARHQVRRMPVVDGRGRVVGIVSQGDLARHAAENADRGERRAMADVLCAVSEPTDRPYR